ncbi:carbohydrate ABC transporter permease [Planotetraspora sp. A-T 1434]|uniref:carbohydrate ABC transporter permease n=1 Tax=Planotetraspora sp. A-T 1434 TaxID=2979219 RepID=UPI0021BEA4B7|nr:carbohydrate ABC transporter permease [Planotetraspora sp. A-T 1434]MCT9929284.1 carbohydrate ABC transporter permease [Planotetraspora sp. A-T 1434]
MPPSSRTVRRSARWSTVVGIGLVAVYLFPIYWMVTASVKTQPAIRAVPPQIVPIDIDLSSWVDRVFGDPRVLRYIFNSFVVATGTMLLTLALAAPAAYALAKLRLRGKSLLMTLSLSSLMFPAIMLATPLFVIFGRLGLTDSYIGLILADTTLALPYAIVLLRPTFARIPKEFSEAARIDGCSEFGAFLRVIVPLARPGLATVAVLAFLWGWGDLVFALTLATEDSMRPVTTGLWGFFGANTSDWGGAMAFSTLAMLPPLIVFLWSQRLVVAGVTAGGIK